MFAPDMMANGLRCKSCQSRKNHDGHVARTYGITPEQYAALDELQDGKCFICHKNAVTRRLAVDHDHSCCDGPVSCGKCVRGLLCKTCNEFLGQIHDDVAALERAIAYLTDPPFGRVL